MHWIYQTILFLAAALGGAVNSVAGGGTLLTFPSLLWAGQSPIVANATSTVALWPGQVGSLWGYRSELGQNRRAILYLAIPSLIGGTIGALLLLHTPHGLFARLVPYLILMATLLFMAQEPLARQQRARAERTAAQGSGGPAVAPDSRGIRSWLVIMVYQLFVGIYGGYFGAGIGILMLASLGLMGFVNIHQMNALKNINGLCINAVAAALFIGSGLVNWRIALFMAVGAIVGGYGGAGTARRIGQRNVRRLIVCIGFALTLSLLIPGSKTSRSHQAPVGARVGN